MTCYWSLLPCRWPMTNYAMHNTRLTAPVTLDWFTIKIHHVHADLKYHWAAWSPWQQSTTSHFCDEYINDNGGCMRNVKFMQRRMGSPELGFYGKCQITDGVLWLDRCLLRRIKVFSGTNPFSDPQCVIKSLLPEWVYDQRCPICQ